MLKGIQRHSFSCITMCSLRTAHTALSTRDHHGRFGQRNRPRAADLDWTRACSRLRFSKLHLWSCVKAEWGLWFRQVTPRNVEKLKSRWQNGEGRDEERKGRGDRRRGERRSQWKCLFYLLLVSNSKVVKRLPSRDNLLRFGVQWCSRHSEVFSSLCIFILNEKCFQSLESLVIFKSGPWAFDNYQTERMCLVKFVESSFHFPWPFKNTWSLDQGHRPPTHHSRMLCAELSSRRPRMERPWKVLTLRYPRCGQLTPLSSFFPLVISPLPNWVPGLFCSLFPPSLPLSKHFVSSHSARCWEHDESG